MWTFITPSRSKLAAALIILVAMWASESLAMHVWAFLNADMFAEMGKRFAEQDPQQMGKMVQDMFSKGWFGGRMMMLLPVFQWISRIVFAYVAACLVNAVGAPSQPRQPATNEPLSQAQAPTSAHGG